MNNSTYHEADSKVKILILAYYDGIGKINYVGSTSSSILQWMQKSDKPWLPWERLRGGQYREWNRVLSFTVLRRMEGKKDLKIYYYWKCDEGILNMCMIWSVRHIGCGSQNQDISVHLLCIPRVWTAVNADCTNTTIAPLNTYSLICSMNLLIGPRYEKCTCIT